MGNTDTWTGLMSGDDGASLSRIPRLLQAKLGGGFHRVVHNKLAGSLVSWRATCWTTVPAVVGIAVHRFDGTHDSDCSGIPTSDKKAARYEN